jgi:cobalt/nickel transport protein
MKDHRQVELTLPFSHPFEGHGMELVKPKAFGVFANGKKTSLLGSLKSEKVMDHPGFEAEYAARRPGVYQFYLEPQPSWEPAEDCHIVHYTKTYVAAYGEEVGWNEPIGLPRMALQLMG